MFRQSYSHPPKEEMILTVDCTAAPEPSAYFEIGQTEIVHTAIGSYRRAASQVDSRFGYRFTLENIGKPHLLTVTYPDDARRLFCIQDGTSYDMTTGVITGGDLPLSGEMKTVSLLFFPRFSDASIVFSTYGYPAEEPVAIASFSISLLSDLPEAELSEVCSLPNRRMIGVQYEDPCNVGSSEGAYEFDTWLERHIAVMKASGQNLLTYPLNWYHGPQVPVSTQPHYRLNSITCPDRKIYSRYTLDTPDWVDQLLTRFDEEGLHYIGSLTLLRLGNLMKVQNTDENSIRSGCDTINNILYNGKPQTSVNDWTAPYTPLIIPKWVEAYSTGTRLKEYAYGEKRTTDVATPIFNPLHPEVRRQLLDYFAELAEKYAHHPSFRGLSVNLWHGTMLWYGNLLAGYDDTSFALFEEETGIKPPIAKDDPERFEKRYAFVIENCKEAFVAWRCRKIRTLILDILAVMRRSRPDLTLGLTVWSETSLMSYLPGKGHLAPYVGAGATLGNRPSNYTLWREAGLDLALFAEDEGITLTVEHNYARDRSQASSGPEASNRMLDFSYLDSETIDALRSTRRAGGFHFDCWVELWGNHTKFVPPEDDPNRAFIESLPDYRAQFLFRENSSYPDDTEGKFFYDSQLRICSPYPSPLYFTEQLTMNLALHDALFLTSGGLYLDKTHLKEKCAIAREYRRLPAVPFDDVPADGPVVVRAHFDGSITHIYAVNREPYSLPVTVTCDDRTLTEEIAPFMLKVWKIEGEHLPLHASAAVPEEIEGDYARQATDLLTRLPAEHWLGHRIEKALHDRAFADLRHLLTCYAAKKARKQAPLNPNPI